jgi:hypothetical protein
MCRAVLADFGVGLREVAALAAAVAEGAVAEMGRTHPGQTVETVLARLARSLQDHRAIDPAMASWALSVWAGALRLPTAGAPGRVDSGRPAAGTVPATAPWGTVPPPSRPIAAPAPAKNRAVLFAALGALGLVLLVAVALAVPSPRPGPKSPPLVPPTSPPTQPTVVSRPGALGLQLDDGPNGGAVIRGFNGDGPGSQAGRRVGDEIVELDGAQVDGAQDLIDRVHGMSAGTIVELTVLRNEAVLHGRVTLAAAS